MSLKLLLSGSQDLTAIQTLRSVIYVSACVHKDACVDVREFLCNQVAVNMCGPDKPGNIHPAKMQALFQTSSVTEHSGLIITSNRRGSDITLHCYKVHACDSTTQGTHPTGNREDLITDYCYPKGPPGLLAIGGVCMISAHDTKKACHHYYSACL